MDGLHPNRGWILAMLLGSLGAAGHASVRVAERGAWQVGVARQQAPAPVERRPPPASYPGRQPGGGSASNLQAIQRHESPGQRGVKGEHLAEWMNQHSQLTPQQQQQALGNEPGFRELPPQTQQRMHDRLQQLNAMPPQQRQRLLARTEAMERLPPEQRAQVRGAMQQLGALPQEQRRTVASSFRAIRELPPEQRPAALSSYRSTLNPAQSSVLDNLMRVEPLLPPPNAVPR